VQDNGTTLAENTLGACLEGLQGGQKHQALGLFGYIHLKWKKVAFLLAFSTERPRSAGAKGEVFWG